MIVTVVHHSTRTRRTLATIAVLAAAAAVLVPSATASAAPTDSVAGCQVSAGQDRPSDPQIAAFRNGTWYVRNTLDSGPADLCFVFGQAGDQPVMGDWNGDELQTPGVFRASTGTWYLSNAPYAQTGADLVVRYGSPGDLAYPGDFNNDKITTVGVWRPGNQTFYLRNTNTDGTADGSFRYGSRGDVPVPALAGHDATLALYRSSNSTFYTRPAESNSGTATVFGNPGDVQLAGPWSSGATGLGGFQSNAVGVYRPSNNTSYLQTRDVNAVPQVSPLVFGNPGDIRIGMAPRCTSFYCGF